jgi:hypothetical protein
MITTLHNFHLSRIGPKPLVLLLCHRVQLILLGSEYLLCDCRHTDIFDIDLYGFLVFMKVHDALLLCFFFAFEFVIEL